MKRFALFAVLVCGLSGAALAQNSIEYDVSVREGIESITTTVQWRMVPAAPAGSPAAPCTATGAEEWAGPKASTGSQTITIARSGDATLALTCEWVGSTTADMSWTPASMNTDGSSYVNRNNTVLAYTFDPAFVFPSSANDMLCMLPQIDCETVRDDVNPRPTTLQITGITQMGTMRSRGFHVNSVGVWSNPSNEATKSFTGSASATESISVTINGRPAELSSLDIT